MTVREALGKILNIKEVIVWFDDAQMIGMPDSLLKCLKEEYLNKNVEYFSEENHRILINACQEMTDD